MGASYYAYRTPVGAVILAADERGLTHASFDKDVAAFDALMPCKANAITNRASTELLEYFAGKRQTFDVPLNPAGSEFQRQVWEALIRIPYAETRTTAQLAVELGMEGSHRAVGAAIKKNPLALFVPDHRIVTAVGATPGTGSASQHRAALLDFERTQALK